MQTIFFVYFAATQLAHQLHQERTRVLDIHKAAGSAWLEGNPAKKRNRTISDRSTLFLASRGI